MRITTCRIFSTSILSTVVGVVVLAASSGCATVSSTDLPWNQKATEAAPGESDAADTEDASSRADATDDATYWAKKAISASTQIAYAHHLRQATEQNRQVVDRTAPSDDGTTSSEESAPQEQPSETSNPEKLAANRAAPSDQGSSDTRQTTTASAGSSDSPRFRTVARNNSPGDPAPRAEGWPIGLPDETDTNSRSDASIDPTLDTDVYDLSDSETRNRVAEDYGFDPSEFKNAVAIPGTYITKEDIDEFAGPAVGGFNRLSTEDRERQIAVVVPGERIVVYAGDEEIASIAFESDKKLPDEALTDVRPVRVIDDGTTQLLFFWSESVEDSEAVHYQAGIMKVIGPHVGTIFQETVAERTTADAGLRKTGYIDFLRGKEASLIRWMPADEEGAPDIEQAKVLEWNEWAGIFRVPKPPPTAPDQQS